MKMLNGAAFAVALLLTTGCAQAGGLGDILGGVLNAPPSNQISGTVQGVDTRAQQVFIQQSNGQTIGLSYDSRTQVVYQNQSYPVTALEYGDRVTVRYQNNGNNGYYVDLIQVEQSASASSGSTGTNRLYTLQGTVRNLDRASGYFTLSTSNSGNITVTMPYNARSTDVNRFNQLRNGDWVSIQGVYISDARFELRQFN